LLLELLLLCEALSPLKNLKLVLVITGLSRMVSTNPWVDEVNWNTAQEDKSENAGKLF